MFFVRTIYVNIVMRIERSPTVDPPRKTECSFPAGRRAEILLTFHDQNKSSRLSFKFILLLLLLLLFAHRVRLRARVGEGARIRDGIFIW